MSGEEPHIVSAIVQRCKDMNIKCLVQVGAEGGHEAEAVRLATDCRAIAIEADSRCSPCSSGLEYYRVVIGATDSIASTFYIYTSKGLSSEMKREEDMGCEVVELKRQRLDTFCREIKAAPDALIIDTEGTTLDVLEGADTLLDGVKFIYAEVQAFSFRKGMRTQDDIDAFLSPRGFKKTWELPSYNGGAQSNLTWVKA